MGQGKKLASRKAGTKTIFVTEYRELIAELIKTRKGLGLSQSEVAAQAGWRDHTYLSKIEKFDRRLDVVDLARLAKIYGKPASYFMNFLNEIQLAR